MTMTKRRKYTAEFKEEAVKLVTEGGCRVSEAARNLDIKPNMLSRWKSELEVPAETRREAADDKQELRRLRKELRRVRMEREILKKAAAFFAQESNGGTDSSGSR